METLWDINIESLINDLDCDVVELIDVIEHNLKELYTHNYILNSVSEKNRGKSSWNDNDPSVPEGWKTRTFLKSGKTRTLFLSPDGTYLKSFRQVFSHMVAVGYADEELITLKKSLKHDGWKAEDPNLPTGWMLKRTKKHVYFLSEDGKYFDNAKDAQEYLKTNKYTNFSADVKQTKPDKKFDENIKDQNPNSVENKPIYKYPVENEQCDITQNIESGWLQNNFLPAGWIHKKPKSSYSYIWVKSREGVFFKSSKQVINYLNSSTEYSEYDVQKFYLFPDGSNKKKTLSNVRGWMNNDFLPEGWKYKQPISSSTYICVKTSQLLPQIKT